MADLMARMLVKTKAEQLVTKLDMKKAVERVFCSAH